MNRSKPPIRSYIAQDNLLIAAAAVCGELGGLTASAFVGTINVDDGMALTLDNNYPVVSDASLVTYAGTVTYTDLVSDAPPVTWTTRQVTDTDTVDQLVEIAM